jgi:uncharacterized Zn-binding protein involved in type VI secretion
VFDADKNPSATTSRKGMYAMNIPIQTNQNPIECSTIAERDSVINDPRYRVAGLSVAVNGVLYWLNSDLQTWSPQKDTITGTVESYPNCKYVVKNPATWNPASFTAADLDGCSSVSVGDRILCPSGSSAGIWIASSSTAAAADLAFVTVEGYTVSCVRSSGPSTYRQTAANGTPTFELQNSAIVQQAVTTAPTDYSHHLRLRTADRAVHGGVQSTDCAISGFATLGNGSDAVAIQCTYTSDGHGVRMPVGGTAAPALTLPAAWLPSTSDWTLVLEYQCLANNTLTAPTLIDISASGSSSRLRIGQGTELSDLDVNGTNIAGVSAYCIHRRRLIIVARSTYYRVFVDGVSVGDYARTLTSDRRNSILCTRRQDICTRHIGSRSVRADASARYR